MALLSFDPSGPTSVLQTLRTHAEIIWARLQDDRQRRAFEALPYDVLKDIGFRANQEQRHD